MLYVEDALIFLFENKHRFRKLNPWHHSFINNLSEHIKRGNPISDQQGKVVPKIIFGLRHSLIEMGIDSNDINDLIANPTHRIPSSSGANIKREVRYIGSQCLAFRFKFDETIRLDFRALQKNELWFDREHKLWIVEVSHQNFFKIQKIIDHHRFSIDKETKKFLDEFYKTCVSSFSLCKDKISGVASNNAEILLGWVVHVVGGELL